MRTDDFDDGEVARNVGKSSKEPGWREQFPIDTAQDEYRSRRDFTKMLGLTSLAFVAGQGFIVAQSLQKEERGPLPELDIAGVEDLAVGAAITFDYPNDGDACVLVRVNESKFVAFGQKCTHLSCPVIPRATEGRFVCPCHRGAFDLMTGQPLEGPPRRALPRINLKILDGRVIASGIEDGVV
jgi:Rieske Fe-S protein